MGEKTGIAWTTSRFGPAPNLPRTGDKAQARHRVNVLVRTARLPKPNDLPCKDCGYAWRRGEHRHEYDHFLGYEAAHHLDVEPVCTICHRQRAMRRGEIEIKNLQRVARARKDLRKRECEKGHTMSYGKDGMWRCYECRRAWYREYRRQRRAGGRRNG